MDIQTGSIVRTTLGEVGRVETVNVVNGVPHFRIRILTATAWGTVATLTTALVNIGDIAAIKKTANAEAPAA
jgi:hypothetical protein